MTFLVWPPHPKLYCCSCGLPARSPAPSTAARRVERRSRRRSRQRGAAAAAVSLRRRGRGNGVADDVVADGGRLLAGRGRVRRRVAHGVQRGRRRAVEVMVRRRRLRRHPRVHRPERVVARVSDDPAAAAGEASPESSSQHGRWSTASHVHIPETAEEKEVQWRPWKNPNLFKNRDGRPW